MAGRGSQWEILVLIGITDAQLQDVQREAIETDFTSRGEKYKQTGNRGTQNIYLCCPIV